MLRGLKITEPNHVWVVDVTYIPMAYGFLYLVAIIDWASRAVLAWPDGAQHPKPSDIPIALLGYRPEFLFVAGPGEFGQRSGLAMYGVRRSRCG